MRLLREERGQAAVMVALSLGVLLGMLALAIDVGQLRFQKEKLQMAADAAAIAGALEISSCGATANCTAMQTAAKDALTENGLTGSTLSTNCATPGSGLTIVLNNGPCALGSSDPNHGSTSYVEVVVSQPQNTIFAGAIGINSVTIKTRAEAGVGNSSGCIYVTGGSGTTFQMTGGTANVSCGIMVDSSGTPAFQAVGATLTATAINITGTDSIVGGTITPSPSTGVAAKSDPLSSTTAPTLGSCGASASSPFTGSASTATVVGGSATFNPGTYCGGISLVGATATFNPGTYILTGNMSLTGATITGTGGVTFYFKSGAPQFVGTENVDLVAPTTGTYAGILFFEDPTDTSSAALVGASGSVFQGALYFPGAALSVTGGNTAAYTIIDSKSLTMTGFNLGDDYSSLPGGSPVKGGSAVLVE